MDDSQELDWNCGRRIIQLDVLAQGLAACQLCGQPSLYLHNTQHELRQALASYLYIKV